MVSGHVIPAWGRVGIRVVKHDCQETTLATAIDEQLHVVWADDEKHSPERKRSIEYWVQIQGRTMPLAERMCSPAERESLKETVRLRTLRFAKGVEERLSEMPKTETNEDALKAVRLFLIMPEGKSRQ